MKVIRKLFSTFCVLSTVSHATTIDVGDIRGSNISEMTYANNTFSIRDTAGVVRNIPQSSIKALDHMTEEVVHAILNSHAALFQVNEMTIEVNFRLRGGRPIPSGSAGSYASSTGSGGGDTSSSVNSELRALRERVGALEQQIAKNTASNVRPEESEQIVITACKATYAATGGAVGGHFGGIPGSVAGSVVGRGLGSIACDPQGVAQSIKEGVKSGVKAGVQAFDRHIQQSARANSSTHYGSPDSNSRTTPGSYACKDGKCSRSYDYTPDFSRSSEYGSSVCVGGKCSGSLADVMAAYERSEGGSTSGGGSGGGDSGDSCCIM